MGRKALLTLALGAILFAAHTAHAQFIGDRMRITTENGEELIGRMKGYDSHSLTIFTDSTEQSIAYVDMARLQRSLGIRSHYRNGAIIGLGMGVHYGAAIRDQGILTGFWGGLGGLTGMLVGAMIRRERWMPLDIPNQGAVSLMPNSDLHPPGLWTLGDRMRITMQHGGEIIGRMDMYDTDSLTILTDTAELSIAYADMMRLQRSLGVRRYPIEGLVIGLGAGSFWGFVQR